MNQSYFWLISIEDGSVLVSLVLIKENRYSITAIGGKVTWNTEDEKSFISAVDASLSQASLKADLSEDQEPENAAFILPPFWVGSDGKISLEKRNLIEPLCKNLNLKPMGFIANDEAIVEEANLKDGFPASFVLVNQNNNSITISLVYLGKIKERIRKPMPNEFSPSLVESALIELNTDSTLPPQIIVFGDVDDEAISSLKNYPWIGKKDTETFLHFPDISHLSLESLTKTFAGVIASQINPDNLQPSPSPKSRLDEEYSTEIEEIDSDSGDSENGNKPEVLQTEEFPEPQVVFANPAAVDIDNIREVSPTELGFGTFESESPPPPSSSGDLPLPEDTVIQDSVPQVMEEIPSAPKKQRKISLPKISLSLLKLPYFPKRTGRILFLLPAASPLLLLIPFFFSKAHIRLFATPYEYNYSAEVTIDTAASAIDVTQKIIPAESKTLAVTASDSIPTTGEKTVGEKAQGEIIIYNKQDKTQNLLENTILVDSSGRNFELVNPVSVAASSSDLDEGIINLGQTKALLIAKDIGPEYNIPKDAKLTFKDHSESILIAKASEAFAGGSKRQIKAVSKADKETLEQRLESGIKAELEKKVEEDLSNLSGLIRDTIQTKKSRVEFNREEGEEAEELSASINATVNVMVVSPDNKKQIISSFLSGQENFDKAEIDADSFDVSYEIKDMAPERASALIRISGQALPQIHDSEIRSNIKGKSLLKTENYLKTIDRVYNYNIKRNFSFLNFINPMPFKPDNIDIEVITEAL